MRSRVAHLVLALAIAVSVPAIGQTLPQGSSAKHPVKKVPANVILVKGAWSSASDSAPVPEDGGVANGVFRDRYFGITYFLPPNWIEKYQGPPPSDSGRYVLAELSRPDTYNGDARGNILITAQDLFFTSLPANNALQLLDYSKGHLQSDYKPEPELGDLAIDGSAFAGFGYWSPIADLHWYVLTTEIRCHAVQFVFMNHNSKALASMVLEASKMRLPKDSGPAAGAGGDGAPVCVKDYATGDNLIERVDPAFAEARYNPVPVRIIIDKRGKVAHIHFLSAFPDQAKAIGDALSQWKFRPYVRNDQAVEVETGIMFGRAPRPIPRASRADLRQRPAHPGS
jgi:hypothetical protein